MRILSVNKIYEEGWDTITLASKEMSTTGNLIVPAFLLFIDSLFGAAAN
jgi:hypothetical protein